MKVLVTGTAGFIGSHVAMRLLSSGYDVVGIDNMSDYYDVHLKKARLSRFISDSAYAHVEIDLADRTSVEDVFKTHAPSRVVHLAAQAGVRYAAENPHVYVASNVTGFLHVLEGCRSVKAEHLVFASTSSVYGADTSLPFSEHQMADHPLTLYAATKKANEMMAHSYSHLFGIPATGLRFFTVYGPWGRPDMALFLFAKAIIEGRPIDVFNGGMHRRSFTYIDDVVEAIVRALNAPPAPNTDWDGKRPDPASSGVAPFRIYNVGSPSSVELMRYVEVLENCLGKKAEINFLPLQAGDVPDTAADVTDLCDDLGYLPRVTVEQGVANFVAWYRQYYGLA